MADLQTIKDLIEVKQIYPGMTRNHLRQCLGEPELVGCCTDRQPVPSVWRYGQAEFAFPPAVTWEEAREQGLIFVYVDRPGQDVEFLLLSKEF